ncbi:FtsB family cell division protein [Herbiconiux sp. SYSU D00978]|uniref:FtsB family cell division protein n=1 Tax=Herbiconiux sp. SYSU D00978 TaxID=2812562 RepID=UPI0027DC161A|nr:septum formation initiator family protein [Herbiconiux sp. SYSU D00978]
MRAPTAERRTERVAPAIPEESALRAWLRGIRFSGFTLVMLGLVVLLVLVLAPNLKVLIEQRQEIAQLQQSVQEQQSQVDELSDEVARWDDPAYIEAQARNRLNYVYPGEYNYLVRDDGQTPVAEDLSVFDDQIQTAQVDWLHASLQSLVTAGLTTAPAPDLVEPPVEDEQ